MKRKDHQQDYRAIVPQTIAPLTLAEVKDNLKVHPNDTSEDVLIQSLINYAVGHCETYTNRAISPQTRKYRMNELLESGYYWEFYGCPIREVTSISYRTNEMTEADEPLIVDPTTYTLDNITKPNRIIPLVGFPTGCVENFGALVTTEHGYINPLTDIPEPLFSAFKNSIHLIVAYFFENREDPVDKLPKTSDNILHYYRIKKY